MCRALITQLGRAFLLFFAAVLVSTAVAGAAKDPYEPNVVMPAGHLKGQSIDAERRRPVTILPADQAAHYGAGLGDVVVANFFSEDRYWIAKIPKDAVSNVILQMEEFYPNSSIQLAPHLQLRFKLKPGKEIQLFPQAGTRQPKNPTVNDLVVTAWTASVKGNDFSIPKSLLGDYVQYIRVLNSQDAFQTGVVRAKHEFRQLVLSVSDRKKSELLEKGLRLSDGQGLNTLFHIKNNNCATFVVCDVLKDVLSDQLGDSSKPMLTYPAKLKSFLSKHDLIDHDSQGEIPNWEKEWNGKIPAPKKKVLVLSASMGGGHNSSAEAIRKRLLAADPNLDVIVKDAGDFMALKTGKFAGRAYDFVYQNKPELWDRAYQKHMADSDQLKDAADIPGFFSEKKLLDYLVTTNPDVLVTTYNGILPALAKLKRDGLITPKNFKIGWLHENFADDNNYVLKAKAVDMTWSPHSEITNSMVQKGVSKHRIQTTTLPLNSKLFDEFPDNARKKFMTKALLTPDRAGDSESSGIWVNGKIQRPNDPNPISLDPKVKTVFISSGKSGLGDFKTIVQGLATNAQRRNMRIQIIVGCGTNEKNYGELTQMKVPNGVTLAVSKTLDNDKQVKYTRSADLVIGKSGSQGPSEFSLSRKPTVLINVVGAQEKSNGEFFKQQGLAELVPGDQQDKVADIAFNLLENPEKLEAMRQADEKFRASVDYQAIDNWILGNLTPEALEGHLPVSGKITTLSNITSDAAMAFKACVTTFLKKTTAPNAP